MIGKRSSMAALFVMTTLLMILMVHDVDAQDITPPNVTCSDVITLSAVPNSFLPSPDQYTYDDANPDPSGVTYNVTFGFLGDLFPPGRTPVTLIAVDTEGNTATCLFFVENPLTELPVYCPDLNRTVATDTGQPTYNYTPSIGPSDVTKEIPGYRYHGDISVVPAMAAGISLDVGTHQDTVVISDDVLSKECVGYIVVQDTTPPDVTCSDVTTLPTVPNSFLPNQNQYSYYDDNPDPSGVTYNVTFGFTGDLFPPGRTPVTLIAVDIFDNMATCLFFVENPLTELPVYCPDLNRTVTTDTGQPTYTYIPSFGANDVTKEIPGYRYHGDISVVPAVTVGISLDVGTHQDTVVILDEVLSKECVGYIVVQDKEQPNVTCPAEITVNSTNVVQFSADVVDNVGASLTYSPQPGTRFSPGSTFVTVTARDEAGLNDTCSFNVQVSLSKLPVECPSDETIQLPSAESTYQYPPLTKDNLTLVDSTYQFYGDVTIDALESTLPTGTHIITLRIDDTILSKTCVSVLAVEERQSSPQSLSESHRTAIIVIVSCLGVLVIIIVVGCCVYCVKKRRKRRKLEINKSAGKETTETTENILMESTPEAD